MALPEGTKGGGPSTPGKPPKPPKPSPPPRGEDKSQYPPVSKEARRRSRRRSRSYRGGGTGGGAGASHGPPRWVIRRQRLLAARGYRIRVDGVWGSKSRRAWAKYQRYLDVASTVNDRPMLSERVLGQRERVRSASTFARNLARLDRTFHSSPSPPAAVGPRPSEGGTGPSDVNRIQRDAETLARAAVTHTSNDRGRTAMRAYWAARRFPGAAENMRLEHLAALITDPGVNFDPTKSEDVKIVQRWLRGHGEKGIRADGKWTDEVSLALGKRFEAAARRERKRQVETIVDAFYAPGYLKAGDQLPSWFPHSFGEVAKVPKPGQLLKLLHENTAYSALLWRALIRQAENPNDRFLQWRIDTFDRMARSLEPWNRGVDRIIGSSWVSDLMTVLGHPRFRSSPGVYNPAERRIWAMLNSSTFDKFELRLKVIEQAEEARYKRLMAERAAASSQWWVKGLEGLGYILKPGEELRTQIVGEAMWLWNDPVSYFKNAGDVFTSATSEEGAYWKARAQEWIHDLPWYARWPYEVVVDPLIFLGPAVKGGAFAVRGSIAASARAAQRLAAAELIAGRGVAPTLQQSARRLEASAVDWFGLSRGTRRMTRALAHPAVDANTGVRAASGAYRGARWATELKQVKVARATYRIGLAMRHGFRRSDASREFGHEIPEFKVMTSRTNGLLDITERELDEAGPAMFASTLRAWHQEGISFYLDAGRKMPSSVGASFRTRIFDGELRNYVIHRTAVSFAYDRHNSVLEGLMLSIDAGDDAAIRAATQKAIHAAREEYERVIRMAGVSTKGGADREIARLIAQQTRLLMDKYDEVIFPWLQRKLEEMAAQAGRTLFDDTGMWAGRTGELAATVKRLALSTFEDPIRVANPLYRVKMEWTEAQDFIYAEIGRRQARLHAYYNREVAGGKSFTDDWLDDQLDAVEDDVRRWWKPVRTDGKVLYQDTREFVEESPLYARHLEEALNVSVDEAGDFAGWFRHITEIALPKGEGAVDREIGEVAWALTDGFGAGPGGVAILDPTARRFPIPASQEFRREQVAAFKQAVLKRQIALHRAYDEALGQSLFDEGAYWAALSHAQTKPLRVLYKSLYYSLQAWTVAVLPLRLAWPVRNMIDNFAKSVVTGVHNPGAFFLGREQVGAFGKAAERVTSIFDVDVRALRAFAYFNDSYLGTRVGENLDGILDAFWMQPTHVTSDVFARSAIPVPEEVLERMAYRPLDFPKVKPNVQLTARELEDVRAFGDDELIADAERMVVKTPDELAAERGLVERWRDSLWSIMGIRPENFAKRTLYRDTYYKALKRGAMPEQAFKEAIAAVEHTLFDYSKISSLEDNLRVFFPFIQFWRKNFAFWGHTVVTKPWVPLAVYRYEQIRDEQHAHLPDWMRRYLSLERVGKSIGQVPGLGWLGEAVANTSTDPLNYLSFAPLYRTFKGTNPELPADRQGWAFIGPFMDYLQDWGLGMNPLLRKPLEHAGILNWRSWQTVFPQTNLIEAFTRKYVSDEFGDFIHNLDAFLADPIVLTIQMAVDQSFDPFTASSELIADRFNTWVQMEMTNQIARGEKPNRQEAERKIRAYLLLQAIVGFGAGAWLRRHTPEDVYLYQLEDAILNGDVEFSDLSDEEQELYRTWRLRKVDRLHFDAYVEALPGIRTYYAAPSYDAAQEFLRENPEIVQYVDPLYTTGRFISSSYVQTASLLTDSEAAFRMFDLAEKLELDPETRALAESWLVTPELRAFWARNDTTEERRQKMLRGLYFRYLNTLSAKFHSIPERDYEAKEGFLADHPELQRFWQYGNSNADDYKAIVNAVYADLRDRYFEFADAGDWDAANAFLTRFPFIFDAILGDDYVLDRETGRSQSQHAQDYLKAKKWLDYYFSLPESARDSWLNGGSEGAQIVRWYFAKYASQRPGSRGGMTQHARDYLAARRWLDHYFALPKRTRADWLNGGSEGARIVLAYFKRYGKFSRMERDFKRLSPGLLDSQDDLLSSRLRFWQRYFELTPDQRPRFVMNHAEEAGVFVYGILSARERHQRENRWFQQAFLITGSQRAAHYLYVRPLLDFFFSLKSKRDKQLFLRANPEVSEYLDQWSRKSVTGDPKLDKLVERYFKLPSGSLERSAFLEQHPEVQDYFDEQSTPAERAIRKLLERYFDLPVGIHREQFLAKHPEVVAYFEKRARERDFMSLQYGAFDDADPRLSTFRELAARDVGDSAERMRYRLAFDSVEAPGLTTRRERRPLLPSQ